MIHSSRFSNTSPLAELPAGWAAKEGVWKGALETLDALHFCHLAREYAPLQRIVDGIEQLEL